MNVILNQCERRVIDQFNAAFFHITHDEFPYSFTLRFSIDLELLPDFIADIKAIRSKTPTVFPAIGILMRFSDKEDIYMSNSYRSQSVHFEYYMINRKDMYNEPSSSLAGYQTILQMLVSYQKFKSGELRLLIKLRRFRGISTGRGHIGVKGTSI